ncbi:MAG: hypothetical protein M3198_07980 [Actinomycetota bacterium]|nr:hypothetical protein [Actinomycetota bacterium]
MRRALSAVTFSVLLLGLVVPVARAGAQATCEHHQRTGRVEIHLRDGYARIKRNDARIQFSAIGTGGYQSCDGATIHDTDRIVFSTTNRETDVSFRVDQSNGRFAPGRTKEDSGASEIEIVANYAPNGDALFDLAGTPRSDTIHMGSRGIKVNKDADLDIKVDDDVGFYQVESGSGNDFVSMNGGSGTGRPVPAADYNGNNLEGGPGADVLIGGPGTNFMDGEDGVDRLVGKLGRDALAGGLDNDGVFGGKGSDYVLSGGDGDDNVEGGEGDDQLYGETGNDHLDGDAGEDVCDGGPGMNTHEECETYEESPLL